MAIDSWQLGFEGPSQQCPWITNHTRSDEKYMKPRKTIAWKCELLHPIRCNLIDSRFPKPSNSINIEKTKILSKPSVSWAVWSKATEPNERGFQIRWTTSQSPPKNIRKTEEKNRKNRHEQEGNKMKGWRGGGGGRRRRRRRRPCVDQYKRRRSTKTTRAKTWRRGRNTGMRRPPRRPPPINAADLWDDRT